MKPNLEALSDEIIVRIFSFLSARDLCRCSKVCSSWCRLANDFHLWKNLFIKKFSRFVSSPSFYNNVTPSQWKELYILKSNWFSGHCHVQKLKKESFNHSDSVLTKVTCLKISKCGENTLSSVNQGSKIVNIWSLEEKRGLHVIRCEGVVSSLDFGCLRSRNLLAIGLSCNKFCLWDFKLARYRLHQTNLSERSLEDFPILQNLSPQFNLSESTVVRVNLVDDKLATVTQDCIIKVWQLNFRPDGSVSCQSLHTLSTNKPRCSVLDIQLKQETVNGYWSVSISHAAEVLENWNLIGFQSVKFQGVNLVNFESPVCNTPVIRYSGCDTDIDDHLEERQEYKRRQPDLESMSSRTFISCLSISPCTKLITSGQNDNTISLWDTSTKTRKHTLFGHTGSVTCTDVDTHKVVSGSNDRTVKVWSLESGDCQLTLPGDHSSGVSCVTFNDQWVVSGDNSGEIKNHIMAKQIYRRIEVQDWMTCLQKCHSDIDCSSYNFKYNSEVGNGCELSKCAIGKGTTWKENDLLFEQGFVFQQIRPSKNENVCATANENDKAPPMSFGGLEQSFILSHGHSYQYWLDLSKYLNDGLDTPRQWNRCYHAYRGNIAPVKFHNGCNSKGPTVTIIRDSDSIFGGYFDHSWKSVNVKDCTWQRSSSAFLFSLNNKNFYEPHRFNIKPEGFRTAVYDCLNYGPTFGHGYDLVVYGNNTELESYSRSASYETPPGCKDAKPCAFYTRNFYFTVDEIEVFYEYK